MYFFPDFQISRCLGQLIVGNVFGQLVLMSIPGPEDLNGLNLLLLADLLAPMATALGKNSTLILYSLKTISGTISIQLNECLTDP